jgi:hypothetical protein
VILSLFSASITQKVYHRAKKARLIFENLQLYLLLLTNIRLSHRLLVNKVTGEQALGTGSIYDWLTQSVLDPTNSGRVTMDNLMKLVIAALAMVV